MRVNDVLISPSITEKAMDKTQSSVYAFQVHRLATKHQIKDAVEQLFGVTVDRVRTFNRKGKVRRAGRRMRPKRGPDVKVAYVKLKKGKIDIFPQT